MNSNTIDVTQASYSQIVIEGSQQNFVVVDFWSPSCEPCRQLLPLLEKLSVEYGFLLAKVNTDEAPELAQHLNVRSVPDVRIYKDRVVIEQFTGALSEEELRGIFNRFMAAAASEIEQSIDAILQLAADGEKEQARSAFSQLLEENPDNSDIKLDYAKLLMEMGDQDQAYTLLSEIKQGDELFP
ncbi:MAG: thioredoxin domain-containing protein, partial [Gammaproteobacteria bacterium]|nr:thioredoxin domain-containing protein [Gammaproteobacteria bacterium]